MTLPDFIITVYCEMDQVLKDLDLTDIRSRGPAPKLLDAEVLTMEVVGEFLGLDAEQSLWRYFRTHYLDWFPHLGSRSSFTKQMANLFNVKQRVQQQLVRKMAASTDQVHIVDGVPIAVCHFARAYFSKCFKGEADYGYCASKKQRYYGFKGHVCINGYGVICGFSLSKASCSERDAVFEVIPSNAQGLLLGDKGYLGKDFSDELQTDCHLTLHTPLRDNMTETRPKSFINAMMKTRRLVETVIGQLTERMHLNKVRARNLWRLSSRIARKILAHTFAVFLRDNGQLYCLDFDQLITA